MILLFLIINQSVDFENLYNMATTSLVQFKSEKDSAFNVLVELGQDTLFADTTIDFLVSKFDTKSAIERHTLKNLLKKIGKSAIRGIVRRINYRGNDEEARSLKQSLWVLGEIGGDEIVEPVVRFMDDDQWQIRSGAYTALGKSTSESALSFVLLGLDDSIPIVRKSAFYALSKVATENEISCLIKGLSDEFYGVRYAAVSGLVSIGEKAVGHLKELIGKSSLLDYFIFKTLSQLDNEKDVISTFGNNENSSVRLLFYEECEDKIILSECLNRENNEFLKNYLLEKIAGLP